MIFNNDIVRSFNSPDDPINNPTDSSTYSLAAARRLLPESHSITWHGTLKTYAIYAAVLPIALLRSLSIAIFVIYISETFNPSATPTLVEKFVAPTLPWTIVAATCTWLYWNGIGKRANGAEDAPIIPSANRKDLSNDTLRVSIAIFATLPSFTSGTLSILASQSADKRNSPPALILATLLGLLSFVVGMLTELVFCFRKHVEYRELQGLPIKPLFQQSLAKPFYDKAAFLGVAIRELYPTLNGIVRAQACDQIITSRLSQSALPLPAINIIRLLCVMPLYSSATFALKNFDVAQLQQGLSAEGYGFSLDNFFSQLKSPYLLPLRILSNTLNGQLLYIALRYCFSLEASVNIMLGLSSVSLAGLAQRNLDVFVSCDNPDATRAGTCSLLTTYLLGTEAAIKIAPKLVWFFSGVAVMGGTAASIIKAPMTQRQARATEEQASHAQHQIMPLR
jgi:hypothetical protein